MGKTYPRKGLILAGGTGSRLYPITLGTSKQLLPVYNKPMIYYPLTTLMFSEIKDILIITTRFDAPQFQRLLEDGSQWGINLSYAIQDEPLGLAQAFIIGEEFINGCPSALILGDNLFHGDELVQKLKEVSSDSEYSTVFAYPVNNPESYGVINFNDQGSIESIEEKPLYPKSRYAMTGLYFFNSSVVDKAKEVKPSERNELEIVDVINMFLDEKKLKVKIMGRGTAWLDTGTPNSLNDASNYIKTIENRQGFNVGSPEEIAWRNGWISDSDLVYLSQRYKNEYGIYLKNLII